MPRFSTSEIPSSTLRNVDYQTAIPRPIYDSQNQNAEEEEETPSALSSPTPSAITQNIAAEISVLEKEFQINKTCLQKEFYSKKNELKKIWFFTNFLEIKDEIQENITNFVMTTEFK